MRKIFFLFASVSFLMSEAQETSTASGMSLEECLNFALENHATVKNANLDYYGADSKVKETISIGLPQVNGKLDYMYNIEVQSQFLPPFDPNAPQDIIQPLAFGVPHSSNASVTATQLIFDGSYLIGLKASKVYKELYEKSVVQTKVDVVEKVKKAYYSVLVNEERLALVKKNQNLINQLYSDSKAMNEAGFLDNVSLQRIEVNKNNLDVEISKLESLVEISYALLKFQMGMEQSQSLGLTDQLDGVILTMGDVNDNVNPENRIEYKIMGVQKHLVELDVKNYKAASLPSLGAFGTIGANIGSGDLGGVFEFGDWRSFSMVGLSLDVPIFSSLRQKHRVDQAKITSEKVTNSMENLEQAIEMESLQAKLTIENSIKAMESQKSNMELAEEVYRVTKIKYDEGVASNYEVIDAETALKTAQTNYYNSLYDAIIAKVDYDKAAGTLFQE